MFKKPSCSVIACPANSSWVFAPQLIGQQIRKHRRTALEIDTVTMFNSIHGMQFEGIRIHRCSNFKKFVLRELTHRHNIRSLTNGRPLASIAIFQFRYWKIASVERTLVDPSPTFPTSLTVTVTRLQQDEKGQCCCTRFLLVDPFFYQGPAATAGRLLTDKICSWK